MHLTGPQLKQFHTALLSSFPTRTKLAQMVRFGLNQDLEAIAEGDNQSDRIFNLLNYAQANGCLPQLLEAALQENPNNAKLRDVAQQLGITQPSPPNPPPTISPSKPTGWSRNQILALGSAFAVVPIVAAGILLNNPQANEPDTSNSSTTTQAQLPELPEEQPQEEQPVKERRPTQSVGASLPNTTDTQESDKQATDKWITLGVVEGKLTSITPGAEFLVGPKQPPLLIAAKTVPNTGDIVPLCPRNSAEASNETSDQANSPANTLMQKGGAIEILELRTAQTPREKTKIQAKVQHFKSTDSAQVGDFTGCSS